MIQINRTVNADSRSGRTKIAVADLEEATLHHVEHVRKGFEFFIQLFEETAANHDHTKFATMEHFHKTLTTQKPGKEVKESPWYRMHTTNERHHLNTRIPEDVNLVDVFEWIIDCVMAGKARAGEVSYKEFERLPYEAMVRAIRNTAKMLDENIEEVIGDD